MTRIILLLPSIFLRARHETGKGKGKAIPVTGRVKVHRVERRRGSHILCRQSAHRWR
jgi:hypothetical protein